MSFWFRTYREHSDDQQNSMLAEIYRLLLQTRSEVTGTQTTASDLEKKRVDIIPTESYIIIITGHCFVKAASRPVNLNYVHYTGREPDTNICRCWLEFNYRSNQLNDRSLMGNNALLKGMPKIVAYQPEYPPSSLRFDGTSGYVDMGNTTKLKLGEAADSEITIAYWQYFPTNPASDGYVVSRGNTNSYAGFVDSTGLIKAQFFYSDATNAILNSTVSGTGAWKRVILSHSDKNDISKIYVDGELKASNTKNDFLRNSGTGADARFMLGAKSTGASTQSNFLGANVKDVKVWNRQLTDTEALDDWNGDYVSPVGLISEWEFDEDEHQSKAFDSIGYNTGTIVNAVYDKDQLPFSLTGNYLYKDGVVDELLGYKTDGQQFLVIPELSDDFRITEPTTGGKTYEWVCKFSDFSKINDNYMRLLQKADDFTGNYIQSIQVRDDGRIYLMYNINGVEKLARTMYPLKTEKLYRIGVGFRHAYKNETPLEMFRVYLNGFQVGLEPTTESSELPASEDIVDFHTYLFAGNEQLRGNYVGQVYSFRYYEEEADPANILGLMTNKFTTRQIDRGHVLRTNLTKLYETTKFRPNTFVGAEPSGVTDLFEYFITDTNPTARFNNIIEEPISITDEFDYTLTGTGIISLGNYSLSLNGTNAYNDCSTIDPVRKNFSISVWVKYLSNKGGWGGIISRIDGLPNANALMVNATQIRWLGKFGDASDPIKDYRVTVPNITGSWHHIAMTYNGNDEGFGQERLKLFLDGQKVLDKHQSEQIKGGDSADNGKTYIGKGADNNFFLGGNIDELTLYSRTLTDSEVILNFLRTPITAGRMAYWKFENDSKDSENGFHSRRHGTTFSTDVP